MTNDHEKVRIFCRYRFGEEYFATPASEVFEDFRQFYHLQVNPGDSAREALERLQEGNEQMVSDPLYAKSMFKRAVQCFPRLARAHSQLGVLADRDGDHAVARDHHERALNIDPADSAIARRYAQFSASRGSMKHAREVLAKFLECDRCNLEVRHAFHTLQNRDFAPPAAGREVDSSYAQNNYGSLFQGLIEVYQPTLVVELGIYEGYSALHMAKALAAGQKRSELHLIDLWDDYPFRHCTMEDTRRNFERSNLLGLSNLLVEFKQVNALDCVSQYRDGSVDLLHIDISNDGTRLRNLIDLWGHKLGPDGLLLFEGGTSERDDIDWMKRYSKAPISELIHSRWFTNKFEYFVHRPFPGLTTARKK